MSQERLMKVLLAPHISEKGTILGDSANQYIFKVATDADKQEIKGAVELLFNVQVAQVRVVNVKGKNKRFGARLGRRSDWKKAYVTLQPDQEISFAGGE